MKKVFFLILFLPLFALAEVVEVKSLFDQEIVEKKEVPLGYRSQKSAKRLGFLESIRQNVLSEEDILYFFNKFVVWAQQIDTLAHRKMLSEAKKRALPVIESIQKENPSILDFKPIYVTNKEFFIKKTRQYDAYRVYDVPAIVLYSKKVHSVIVVFHGSSGNRRDWMNNFQVTVRPINSLPHFRSLAPSNVFAHSGFLNAVHAAFKKMMNIILSMVDLYTTKDNIAPDVVFSGYSRGGALALLSAGLVKRRLAQVALIKENLNILEDKNYADIDISVVSLAAPKVLVKESTRRWFHKVLLEKNVFLYVKEQDIVPSMPFWNKDYITYGTKYIVYTEETIAEEASRKLNSIFERFNLFKKIKEFLKNHFVDVKDWKFNVEFNPKNIRLRENTKAIFASQSKATS